ncbi:MAG: RNA-binding transcriptional accessory protein [Deltaproteobacteria bacterium]|nr:RNA-binding transcriptional accessory protein [Deltaproteobacteria bacterium]
MNENHILKIASELNLKPHQVRATVQLLEGDATVPFIARYRKEATGSLDEVAIAAIRDRSVQLYELDKRRESILKSLVERELLTEELESKILAAETMTTLEDIYLPFRPKRRTRATIAREKGLEPLARILFDQEDGTDPASEAALYIDPEKGVESVEDALAGARDVIAEWVNEDQETREKVRALFMEKGTYSAMVIPGKEDTGVKFRDYFDWEEPVASAPSHRVLAMRRGEKEEILSLSITPPEEEALNLLDDMFVKGSGEASEEVRAAVHDSYKRLLSLSMETEVRLATKKRADEEAIRIFSANLRELLLASPLGQKRVLAIDPGIRTGCKIACMDPQGQMRHIDTIYPFKSKQEETASADKVRKMCEQYQVEAVAVGNGTAGRETESFVRGLDLKVPVILVNESGASVYSASDVARAEFPDLDVSFRGAVSIGRRLMDPLAELVKIDPKSIGVGQYQHDVNQQDLKASLDDVVISCVNAVGVEVNTASEQLLTYVSGLGPQLAKNIVAFRNENGPFSSRKRLSKVPRLGPKAIEQAAGFLRIRDAENPLDASAVHPESYHIVAAMADDLECAVDDLIHNEGMRSRIDLSRYISENVGMPTLKDIMSELAKPGRDPREQLETMEFTQGVNSIGDLEPGMQLPGVVTNVTAFGAFVDIGVHQDGLVHISQLADRFVKNPQDVVRVNQRVTVTVLSVDPERNRISLSMKSDAGQDKEPSQRLAERKRKGTGKTGWKKDRRLRGKREKKPSSAPFNNPFTRTFKGGERVD